MNVQANDVTLSFVESFESYTIDSKAMGELKTRLEDARKILEPVIRAHKIAVDDNKAWKEKRAIFYPLVKELEWPALDEDDVQDEKLKALKKKAEARIAAWLGVIRTCLEYQILPTDKNADRLRKAKVWTALNGNGKVNPNWVDPNAPKVEAQPLESAPVQTDSAPIAPVMQTQTTAPAQTAPKAVSVKPVTPQKTQEPVHPLTSNVSSSEEPISAREHCGILLDQLFKNEAFRGEFAPILAMCLDSNVATVTRCLVEARDAMLNGKGVKA